MDEGQEKPLHKVELYVYGVPGESPVEVAQRVLVALRTGNHNRVFQSWKGHFVVNDGAGNRHSVGPEEAPGVGRLVARKV